MHTLRPFLSQEKISFLDEPYSRTRFNFWSWSSRIGRRHKDAHDYMPFYYFWNLHAGASFGGLNLQQV